MSAPVSPARRWAFGGVTALAVSAVAAALLAPWWRNHDLLRDFYDYGLVIAGSVRIALGEKPYVDFTTPIQTLHFLLARLTEIWIGERYLSLTYANALVIVGGFFGMTALLWRRLGAIAAVLVAAGVVTASAGQHTIVWHNALGVFWTAGVVWLTARAPAARRREEIGRLVVVWVLLWLGGMTKVTYQVTALSFAGLFAWRDALNGGRSWRLTLALLASYAGFGAVLPVLTELFYTGASFETWRANVLLTPGRRVEMLREIVRLRFYLGVSHDHYRPILFPWIGAWGVALLAAVTMIVWRAQQSGRGIAVAAIAGVWICSAVIQATNLDIIYLAGAIWLVLAVGATLALSGAGQQAVPRAGRAVLAIAAVMLLLPAWQAAWQGVRALWDSSPGDRSALVSCDDLPERYGYLRGLKITPALHRSLQGLAAVQGRLASEGRGTEAFYFTNGAEFLLRAYQGARLPGLPLWLHEGTTYGAETAPAIASRLASAEIQGVVSLGGWYLWRHDLEWYLDARFQYERVGEALHLNLSREDPRLRWSDPLSFAATTGSTVLPSDLEPAGGPFLLRPAERGGRFLGTPRSGKLAFRGNIRAVSGVVVVRRAAAAGESPLDMVWRIVARDARGGETVIKEARWVLPREEAERAEAFSVAAGDRAITLELYLPPDLRLEAGFRELTAEWTHREKDSSLPDLLHENAPAASGGEDWAAALFAEDSWRPANLRGASIAFFPHRTETGAQLFAHAPSVVWFPVSADRHGCRGEFGLNAAAWSNPDSLNGVVVRVVYFRPGFLRVLHERELRPRVRDEDRAAQRFEVNLPGEEGWVGLVMTTLDSPRNNHGQAWWRNVRVTGE